MKYAAMQLSQTDSETSLHNAIPSIPPLPDQTRCLFYLAFLHIAFALLLFATNFMSFGIRGLSIYILGATVSQTSDLAYRSDYIKVYKEAELIFVGAYHHYNHTFVWLQHLIVKKIKNRSQPARP
jgi:hypothetical protein